MTTKRGSIKTSSGDLKLSGSATDVLRGDGTWGEGGGSDSRPGLPIVLNGNSTTTPAETQIVNGNSA